MTKQDASSIIQHTRALVGRKGAYLAYFFVDTLHIRMLGDPNPSLELWVDIPASQGSWLPIACLTIGAWERAVDLSFMAVYPTRQGAWSIATSGEGKRDRAYVYSEYLRDGMWHVATYMPRGTA